MKFFSNDFAEICHYKTSLRGAVEDYQINFTDSQCDIDEILLHTLNIFKQLIESLKENGKRLKGRLIAKAIYEHVNVITNETSERDYHFSSNQTEEIDDIETFYAKHMEKIVSRMENFQRNGSNLILKRIEHLHIQLSFLN